MAREFITIQESIKRELKGGMTRESRRRNLHLKIRYYFLILGSNFLGMESYETKWEGPFTVVSTSSHGAITLQNNEGTLFKVNGHRLKMFLESDKPLEVVDKLDFIIQ
jgi:hypothetical protein